MCQSNNEEDVSRLIELLDDDQSDMPRKINLKDLRSNRTFLHCACIGGTDKYSFDLTLKLRLLMNRKFDRMTYTTKRTAFILALNINYQILSNDVIDCY
jgi:hypothetical protein